MSAPPVVSRDTAAQRPPRTFRFWLIAAGAFSLAGLLRFSYFYLDDLTRLHAGTFGRRLLEESTGSYTALLCFAGLVALYDRLPLTGATWKRRWPVYSLGFVGYTTVHTSLMWITRLFLSPVVGLGPYDYGKFPTRFFMEAGEDAVSFVTLTIILIFLDTYRGRQDSERRAHELERHFIRAQLESLRRQLQPHFLFNALNTISHEMYENPALADEMIGHLAELLRQAIRTAERQEVALAEELALLDHYVALMRARFSDDLVIVIDVDSESRTGFVPSLLLQPLVENAVRHGNTTRYGHGRVEVRGRRAGEWLSIEVNDDGETSREEAGPTEGARGGSGLTTTGERLELLYPGTHTFEAGPLPEGGFQVSIRIPYRPAASRALASEGEIGGPGRALPLSTQIIDARSPG